MSVKQHTKPKPKPTTLATNPRSKPTPIQKPKTISKAKTKKKDGAKEGGDLDEIGNPFPLKNPEGGDPICPGGYKIDYDFDVLDPINPPFRCISALKDTSDSISKIMNKLNNPASSITDITNNAIPIKIPGAAGGGRKHTSRRTLRLRRSNRRKHTHRRNKK
jgi:hypothetical protein